MKFVLLLSAIVLSTVVVSSQKETLPSLKLISIPDPSFAKTELPLALGNDIKVIMSVDAQGNATYVSVSGPSFPCSEFNDGGITNLRRAAVEAAKRATFEAAMKDGKAVPSTAVVTFNIPMPPDVEHDDLTGPNAQKNILNGKALVLPHPAYPYKAYQIHLGSDVTIKTLINENGRVIAVAPESGSDLFFQASMVSACGSKFTPTLLNGQAIKVLGLITYHFNP